MLILEQELFARYSDILKMLLKFYGNEVIRGYNVYLMMKVKNSRYCLTKYSQRNFPWHGITLLDLIHPPHRVSY